jgi:hypothetical protein
MIVQLAPGLTTEPEAHVPPVIEKVPTAGPTLVIDGTAVRVSGPVALIALLTVMVPFFVVVVAGVVVRPGVGAEMATVAPVTWKGTVSVVGPIGVLTMTFLVVVSEAPAVITQDAATVVAFGGGAVSVQVMPPPLMDTAVAPVRFVPVRVTGTVVPRSPLVGEIEVSVGPVTVKVTGLLAIPFAFVTVTL